MLICPMKIHELCFNFYFLEDAHFLSKCRKLSKHFETNVNLTFVWIDPEPFQTVSATLLVELIARTYLFIYLFMKKHVKNVKLSRSTKGNRIYSFGELFLI